MRNQKQLVKLIVAVFVVIGWGLSPALSDGLPPDDDAALATVSDTDAESSQVAEVEVQAVTEESDDDDLDVVMTEPQPPLSGDVGDKTAGAALPPPSQDNWRIGAGGLWRSIKSRSWRSGSYSQDYTIHAKSADRVRRSNAGGTLNDVVDRRYLDGYVLHDDWTGLDGETWNWGYDSPRQVRGDGNLWLRWRERIVTDHRRNIEFSEALQYDSGENEPGLYLRAQRTVYRAPKWDLRMHLDFMRVVSGMDGRASNFRDEQTWRTWEEYRMDIFSLDGTGITGQSPPYQGNYDDTGPAIHNVPIRRQGGGNRVLSERSYVAFNEINHDLDLRLMTFSLGMVLNYNYRRLNLSGVTGPTINLAETDSTYRETLYESWNGGPATAVQFWQRDRQDSDTTFGYFVQAEIGLRLTSWLEMGVFGRYDWLENIHRDVGQSRYEINPEGGSVGGTLSLVF